MGKSLLDIVKEGPAEISSSMEAKETVGEENIPDQEEFLDSDFEESSDIPNEHLVNTVSNQDTNLFSGAFEEIEYQSVELELPEEQPPVVREENTSRYAQIVQDALKSSPKQKVQTVLGPESDLQDSCLVDVRKTDFTEKNKDLLSTKSEDSTYTSEKEGDLSDNSVKEGVVSPPKKSVIQKPNLSAKVESEKAASSKFEKNVKSNIFSDNEQKSFFEMEKPDSLKKDIHEDVLPKRGIKETPVPEIAFLYNEKHVEHDPSSLSIKTYENPGRLVKAMWYLEKSGIFRNEECTLINDFDMATEEDLLRVHDESYVGFVKSYSTAGGGFLGDSTYMTPKSYDVAKLSAGAAIKAGSLVADGKYPYAFVMTRPPGHHASNSRYGGFCLFNNGAILARYLQEKKNVEKVLIIDWDAHAGDGTMDIFYNDPTVLFVSLHRDPHGFYPRKGFSEETGDGPGKGYTVNVEMPVDAGNEEYAFAFEEVVIPLIKSFSPEFIICSCGFDAYYKEKNIGLRLTSDGFHRMTSMIRSLYPKNFILLMEGGYHDFNGQLCHSVLSALRDEPNPVEDQFEMSSFKKNQQQKILADTQAKITEVKKLIPMLM
ncbi:histone deacetylase [Methanolobus sp. ZRKC2]|uniref:histone deacetylase family protein n=1 Tax=Methanolobus sp. ZRKC2 TaxID=3125783 RepID=UPI00324AA43D